MEEKILFERTYQAGIEHGRVLKASCKLRSLGWQAPAFSVTGRIFDRHGKLESGGTLHVDILTSFPGLDPIVDLHLSDSEGVPMHDEENGWYWAGGTRWNGSAPGDPPNAGHLARHLRINAEMAADIVGKVTGNEMSREDFNAYLDSLRPRWRAEAEAAIEFLDTGFWPEGEPTPSAPAP